MLDDFMISCIDYFLPCLMHSLRFILCRSIHTLIVEAGQLPLRVIYCRTANISSTVLNFSLALPFLALLISA
jgi:hypothetical protein